MTYRKWTRTKGIPADLTLREEVKDRTGNSKWEDRLISDATNSIMLGLNLSNNLNWDSHLNTGKKAILPALRRQIGLLSKLSYVISKRAKLRLVNYLVLSRLLYGLLGWVKIT